MRSDKKDRFDLLEIGCYVLLILLWGFQHVTAWQKMNFFNRLTGNNDENNDKEGKKNISHDL